jgi:hypothetical protein
MSRNEASAIALVRQAISPAWLSSDPRGEPILPLQETKHFLDQHRFNKDLPAE